MGSWTEQEFKQVQRQRDELMDQLGDLHDQVGRLGGIVGVYATQGTAPELRVMVDRVYALSRAVHSLGRKVDRVRALHKQFHAEAVKGSPGRLACCRHLYQLVNELTQAVESDLPLVVMADAPGWQGPDMHAEHPAIVAAGNVELRARDEERRRLLGVIADAAAELRRWHPRTELAARLYERLMAPLRAAGWEAGHAKPIEPEGSSTDAARVENLEAENQELREKLTELDRAYDEQKTAVTAAEELRAKLAATQQQVGRLQKTLLEDGEELRDWTALAVKRRKSRNEALTILRNGTIRPDLAVVKAAEVLDKCSETDIGAERQLIANLAELEELKAFRGKVLQGVEEKGEYERRYAELLGGVADVARRVGPAVRPEWVREQLEGIMNTQGRRGQLLEFADKAVLAENQRLGQVCGDRLDAIRELQQQIAELERLVQRQRAELAEKSQAIEQQRQGLEDAAKGREVLEQRGRADRERLHDCQQALRSAQDREELAEARVANAVGYADECLAAGGPGGKFYWNKLRMFLTLGQQPAVPAADHQKATEELIAKVKAEKERGDRLNRENDDLCGRVKRLEQEKAELLVLSADAAKKLHEARQANDHLGEKVEAQRSTIDSQAEWAQQRAARIETLEARIDAAVEQIERRDPSGAFEWCNEVKSILTGFRAN